MRVLHARAAQNNAVIIDERATLIFLSKKIEFKLCSDTTHLSVNFSLVFAAIDLVYNSARKYLFQMNLQLRY